MVILAVDSSGLTASAAVFKDGYIVAVNSVNNGKTHSQTLLPMIEQVMKQAETEVAELDAIAVAGGPGSFTGLRIGAATVKGLAFAAEKPVVFVSTLEALAYNVAGTDKLVCPVMDARRGQVYTAAYTFEGEIIHEVYAPEAVGMDYVLDRLGGEQHGKKVIFLGDGVVVFEELIRDKLGDDAVIVPMHQRLQNAASVAMLAARKYENGICVTGAEFEPVYLRLSQAERERLEKENS